MTQDEQEAESRRYGSGAFFVLPLTSGRIAVLSPRRELMRVVDSWPEALEYGPTVEGIMLSKYKAGFPKSPTVPQLAIDLSELDL